MSQDPSDSLLMKSLLAVDSFLQAKLELSAEDLRVFQMIITNCQTLKRQAVQNADLL